MSPLSAFAAGASYHAKALALLKQERQLWRYLVMPVAVTMLVGGAFYAGALWAGWHGIEWLVARLPEWLQLVAGLLRVAMVLGLLLLTGVLMARFGVILGSPWYGALAEAIERMKLAPEQIPAPQGFLPGIGAALGYELKKLAVVLGVGLPLLAMNLVPGAGTIVASVGGFMLGMTIISMDMLDPALGRRGFKFRRKLATVVRGMPATAGFGAVAVVLTSIPLVNMLTVPLSVTAGMLLFCEQVAPKLDVQAASA